MNPLPHVNREMALMMLNMLSHSVPNGDRHKSLSIRNGETHE